MAAKKPNTPKAVLAELKTLGTAQNVKVYGRHGVKPPLYGVSYANLGKLKKRIGVDHDVAVDLWTSGVHDARVLATMVADPDAATAKLVDGWAGELNNYVLSDAFVGFVAKTQIAKTRATRWKSAKNEWKSAAGWGLIGALAETPAFTDAELTSIVDEIQCTIHDQKNRTRHAMNMALICIGLRNKKMEALALNAAKAIGVVEVDHGETSCKTPSAAAYIRKTALHRKKRAAKKKATKRKATRKKKRARSR